MDFARDVQPVLTSKCLTCHSGSSAQAELKLHTRAELLSGGASGPAIVPGDAENSLLVRKISGQQGMRMPPAGAPLAPETIAIFRQWIDEGARFEGVLGTADRLAPMAPRNPAIPAGVSPHPIDRFIGEYLQRQGIAIADPVSDAVFARRVYYDVVGVPPSPAELEAFVSDTDPGKREALVDRLLARCTQYAEHWMSYWNDLLRNDEGVIYHGERKSITKWLYHALETNKPYHEMAGELLNPAREPAAEGYLTGVTWRGVVSASQSPPMQASQNAAQVFLGMNLKCAACHDSFVNRWKLADTYGLAAMFADEDLELVRCDVKTGKLAEARFPVDDLGVSFDSSLASRREAAAAWFTHPSNGRFSRTLVNRYWKQLMGRALVEPIDDMDADPWHRDLLDWLASDFASNGYDLQSLLRNIMTSHAYQMPAVYEPGTSEPGKDESYVFRGPHLRRLSAEQFQDTISTVSGEWRVTVPRADTYARYTREWRLKSDPLSRALGRPIRDQVYTERSQETSTLQSLEFTNGPLLSKRIENAARSLVGERQPAPENRFDSGMMRSGAAAVDVDISGARELWLLVEDVDSYDPSRVVAGWVNASTIRGRRKRRMASPDTEMLLQDGKRKAIAAPLGSALHFPLDGKQKRFVAQAVVDERSRQSDIGPAVRFFVFTEKPDLERLVRVEGAPPVAPVPREWTREALATYLYTHLLGRAPEAAELELAAKMLGESRPTLEGTSDLLWALLMSPEFQFLH